MTATQEFVVPRSMPITFAISVSLRLAGFQDPEGIPAKAPFRLDFRTSTAIRGR
jgi:hypothetical protein